jgi:segregation and condensation protein A
MNYHVSTAVFEGPLDLLLHLITRHQVDIADVSLTGLVSEYVGFISEMKDFDMEVTSEFLLIAATLIQLKAHRILPPGTEVDLDEELALMEERDRLLARLLMCLTFKDVAAVLHRRLQETNRLVPRIAGLDQAVIVSAPDVTIPVDHNGLSAVAARVLSRSLARPDLDHLDLELPSVESAIHELSVRITAIVESTFDDLVSHCRRQVEVAAYFLALLEMARWGLLEVSQADWLSPIHVRSRPSPVLDLT